MVPRTSSTLSSPEANHVPYQKLPALPLLLLTLPSRLGSWSILSIFPMTASRGRRLHPRLVPPCINCSPSYPWCSDLYSARRIAQAKVREL